MKTRAVGILVFAAVVVGAAWCGGSLSFFVNLPGIAYVVMAAGGLGLIRYRKGEGIAGFFSGGKKYLIIGGILAWLTGIIQMAATCIDANSLNAADYFAGFAVATLSLFYGLILYCIVDAFTA